MILKLSDLLEQPGGFLQVYLQLGSTTDQLILNFWAEAQAAGFWKAPNTTLMGSQGCVSYNLISCTAPLAENFKTWLSTKLKNINFIPPKFVIAYVYDCKIWQNENAKQINVLCILPTYPFPPVNVVTIILQLLLQNFRDFYSYCSFFHFSFCLKLWFFFLQYQNSIFNYLKQ